MAPKPGVHLTELDGYTNNGYQSDVVNNELDIKDDKDEDKKPLIDFDDLLPHIGEFGKYQKILFLLMIPFAFCVAFVYFSQIFITLVPEDHWCRIPELEHLDQEQRFVLLTILLQLHLIKIIHNFEKY